MRKLDVYPEEGKCPFCGSVNVSFEKAEIDESGLSYHCECADCGGSYDECYDVVFAGHWNLQDKEGNEYEDLAT